MDKFNRDNFLKSQTVDGIDEKDLLTNSTNIFDSQINYNYYTVKEEDLLRPDLISFKKYSNINYWWIIMKANNIEDVWNDLYVGQVLSIPTLTDIDKYYLEKNKR